MKKIFGSQVISSRASSFVLGVVTAIALTAISVSAATTISTDITTGGALTVTGTSALGVATVSSTLTVTGLTTLGFASTTAVSLNGTSANLMINGLATTTASTGNFGTVGKIGAGTTTPTTLELSAEGSATTTIGAFSTTALTGGCIQLEATNGVIYRMYLNATDVATTTSTGHQGIIAVWELGSCK